MKNQHLFEIFSQIDVDFFCCLRIILVRRCHLCLFNFALRILNHLEMIQFWICLRPKLQSIQIELFPLAMKNLLSVAAIYGANASGKSNVIEAFRFMVTYVLESFSYGGDADDKKSKIKE